MVRVAVAGGTGAVGQTFVEVLTNSKKHEVFVLTRKASAAGSHTSGVEYIVANYDDIDATTRALEDNSINTVVSAISLDEQVGGISQMSLIKAADRSKTTTRFIPSEYSIIMTPEILEIAPPFQSWIDNAQLLKETNLKYTRIANGFFMDYWGTPHLKSYLNPFPWAVNVEQKTAAIPGSGDEVLTMTYSFDLANFVLRLLDTDDWPEICAISGQDVTLNQLLKWAEDARGSKFDVTFDDETVLKEGRATLLGTDTGRDELIQFLTSMFGRITIAGHFKVPENDRQTGLFPDLEFKRVDDMIKDSWTGR